MGISMKKQDRTSRNASRSRTGFTLIELLTVISIIALLVGILLPSLASARRQSKKAVCQSNLRQIGTGIQAYLQDNREYYPFAASYPTMEPVIARGEGRDPYPTLPEALSEQLPGGGEVFRCPADRNLMTPDMGYTYFETEKTSYEWLSSYNGQKVDHDPLTSTLGRRSAPMVWDFEAFHGGPEKQGSHQVLYASLDVRDDNWEAGRNVSEKYP